MMKNKYEKGITLVALVITIIVMLILAGVSINAIVGENGIIGRAKEATEKYKVAQYQEQMEMEVAALRMDKFEDSNSFFEAVKSSLSTKPEFENAQYTIKKDDRLIITTEDGKIFEVKRNSGKVSYLGTKEEISSNLPEELKQADIKFEYSTKGWTKDPVKVVISCEKYPTNEIEYSYDLTKWETFTGELSIGENKAIYVRIANEVGATDTYAVGGVGNIDTKAPEIKTGITEDESKKTTKGFTVSIEVQDTDEKEENASGIGKVVWYYKAAGTDNFNTYKTIEDVAQNSTTNGSRSVKTFTMSYDNLPTGNGTYNVYADVYDVAGNVKPTEVVDIELKSVTVSEHKYSPRYWTNGAVEVTLPIVEGCTTKYSIDDDKLVSPTEYTGEFQVVNNCDIYYYVTDGTNIVGTGSQAINNIDATEGTKNPIIVSGLAQEGTATTSTIKTTITVQDTISGFSHIDWYYKLASSTGEYTKVAMDGADENYMAMNGNNTGKTEQLTISKEFINLQQGEDYEFYAEVYDVAGNKVVSPANYITAPLSIRTAQTYVTDIVLNPTSKTINVGEKAQITATVNPSGAKIQTVEWHTSNAGVATVSSTGEVTAVGPGEAQITAKSTDGSNKTSNACTITVIQPVSGVSVSPTTASINVGGTKQLTATVAPSNATNKTVTWSTGNSAIATVSNTGLITAKGKGTTTITATTADGNKTASCSVTVTQPVTGVSLNTSTASVNIGATVTLTATVSPSNANNQNVTWSTGNSAVATVANGVVTGVAAGSTTITVTTADGNKTASCTVTVNNPYVNAGKYLVDVVDIGTYVNGGTVNGGNWRVLSKSGSGASGVVELVSANNPITYKHLSGGKSAESIAALEDLTEEYASWKNVNYVDQTKGCHAFGCSTNYTDGTGSKATKYSPLNEVETLYTAITGQTKTMKEFYNTSASPFSDSSLQTAAGTRWKSIYAGLLCNGSYYWHGGASYDTSRLWCVLDSGSVSYSSAYTCGARPVVSLQSGVKVQSTNTGDGTSVDKAYILTK